MPPQSPITNPKSKILLSLFSLLSLFFLLPLFSLALPVQTISSLALSPVSADATPPVTTNRWFSQSATLLLTNCTALADSGAPIDLTDLSLHVGIATALASTSTVWHAGAATNPTNGVWAAAVTLPAASPAYWQLRLTDAATNTFHYPIQQLRTRGHL